MGRYLKVGYTNDINYILSLKPKGLSNLEIDSIKTNNYLNNIEQFSRNRERYAKMGPREHDTKTFFSVVTIIVILRTPVRVSLMKKY